MQTTPAYLATREQLAELAKINNVQRTVEKILGERKPKVPSPTVEALSAMWEMRANAWKFETK